MKHLLLLIFLFACSHARAEIPTQFIGASNQPRHTWPTQNDFLVPGGMEAVLQYIETRVLTEDEAMDLIHVTIRHCGYGDGSPEKLASVLNALIDRFPHSNEVLEGATESIRFAETVARRKHGVTQPASVPGAQEILRRIEKSASPNSSDNVFFHLSLVYAEFPDFRPPGGQENIEKNGVLQAGSRYHDLGTAGGSIRENGTGTVLNIPQLSKHPFLLTAAHLVDGSDPWVEIEGKKRFIASENILCDNDNDIALVELPGDGAQAAIRFDPKDKSFRPETRFQRSLNLQQVPAVDVHNRYDFLKYDQTERGLGFHAYLRYRIVEPPWAQKFSDSGYKDSIRSLPPELVSGGDQIHVRAKTSPGMSGTILLENDLNGDTKVVGVLTQYNYYFADSYFASEKTLQALVAQFGEGKRGRTGDTSWEMKNKLTYRNFGNEFIEANFIGAPSGNGVGGEPGNGVHGDPGTVDPECLRQAGITDESFAELLATASKMKELSPSSVFAGFAIAPGMLWKGKSVMGIEVVPKSKGSRGFLLYPNAQAVSFMRKNAGEFGFKPVLQGADLQPFARKKLEQIFGATSSLEMNKRKITLKGGRALAEFTDNEIKLTLAGDYDRDPVAHIVLDAQGKASGQAQFLPIVEAASGESSFVVDLRQLYFTDLSDVAQHLTRADKLPDSASEALTAYNQNIQLPYKNKGTGAEGTAVFVPTDCSNNLGSSLADGSSSNWISAGRYSRSKCTILERVE